MTKADSPKPPSKLETITLKVFIHCEGCRRKVRRIIRVLDGVEDVTVDSPTGKVTVTGTTDVKTILQRLQKYGKNAEMWPSSNPAPPTAKAGANQPKPNNNNNGSDSNNKKKSNDGGEGGDKTAATAAENGSKKGGGKKEATPSAAAKSEEVKSNESKPEKSKESNPEEASNANTPTQNGGGGNGGGGKKGGKKGGNGNNASNSSNNPGGGNGNMPEVLSLGPPTPVHDIPAMSATNSSIAVAASKSLAPYDSIQTGYAYHSAEYATHMFSDENANNCSIM